MKKILNGVLLLCLLLGLSTLTTGCSAEKPESECHNTCMKNNTGSMSYSVRDEYCKFVCHETD